MSVSFQQCTLPNGLTVLGEISPAAHTAAVGFFVRTGARDEDRGVMGVSHFLEHMMFKGSQRRSAEEVNDAFDSMGADHNAFTSGELTVFHAHVLPEFLLPALDVLADILRPALRQADFDEEKGVILEEIAMYDDNPFWVLYEHALERYFGGHPLSHRVLGTRDTITSLTSGQMRDYFNARYSSDNTVVAVAGRVDFDAVVAAAGAACGAWTPTAPTRLHPAFQPRPDSFQLPLKTATRAYMTWILPAPSIEDPRRYAASVLMQVLGDTEGSRLYWSLVEPGIAEEAEAGFDGRDGLGAFVVSAACEPASADRVDEVVRRELRDLPGSLTEDDLSRARNKIATSVALAGERPAGRMHRLGSVWTYRREYLPLEEEMRRLDALTLRDLRECAEAFPLVPVLAGRVVPADQAANGS